MDEHPPLALQIEEWTREALVQWGGDWVQIAAHIRTRFAELGEEARLKVTTEASLTLLGPSGNEADDSAH